MITDNVIKEIYKKFNKPLKNREDLQLDYFLPILKGIPLYRGVG